MEATLNSDPAYGVAPARTPRDRFGVPALAAVISLALTLIWTLSETGRPFYFDSLNYWTLANTFVAQHHFSLLNFHDSLRGYLYPLLAYVLQKIGIGLSIGDSVMVRIFNALIVMSTGALLVPRLAELAWPQRRWGVGRRVLLTMLIMLMWSGFLMFPLTDLPALALALLALVACSAERTLSPPWMFVGGLASAATLDLRPAYLLLTPVVTVLVLFAWFQARRSDNPCHGRRLVCVVLAIVAFALVSLPQALITHKTFHSWSIIPGTKAGLTALQYTDGAELQLYNTYVGEGHSPGLDFLDPGGVLLLGKIPGGRITSLSQLGRLTIDYPHIMGALFIRHIINGLDQRYASPYITHLRITDWWSRMLGFGLVLLALARLAWPPARRGLGVIRWRYILAVLVSGATAVASAVEPRFMLPVAVLSYATVLAPGWLGLVRLRSRPGTEMVIHRRDVLSGAAIVVVAAALVVLIIVVVHATNHHLVYD